VKLDQRLKDAIVGAVLSSSGTIKIVLESDRYSNAKLLAQIESDLKIIREIIKGLAHVR
jgi:hypothetical protein